MADPRPRVILEVCVASVEDALEAVRGGADRLELNVALELGGLTPSAALLAEVKQVVDVPVIAMVRPRGAGFVYRETEAGVMLRDAERLLEDGADGIAWGALSDDRSIDVGICHAVVQLAGARQTVFHRAFDLVADPQRAANELADLGVRRIMTSGRAISALEGGAMIAQLQEQMGPYVEFLPAGGVRPDNVCELLQRTGCTQVHGSFRSYRDDPAWPVANSRYGVTDRSLVAAARRALDGMAGQVC